MLKRYRLDCGKIAECGDFDQILVYINPDEEEKKFLTGTLKIDEHTLNSALDPDELSRLEFEPEHIALIYKRPKSYSAQDEYLFKVASTGLFLFKQQIVIVISEDIPLFESKQFAKVASLPDAMLRLIYRSIFQYLEHLKTITLMTDALEQKVSSSMENKYLFSLFTLEKSLVYYMNAINSNSMLIEKLKYNAAKIGFTQEEIEFLDDITIENSQCYKQAEIYSNILAGLMDARASIVNNNLNVLMKTLNIVTIGIMVPTLVVSAFSMNVSMPFDHTHPAAFWSILGLASVSVVSFMLFWRYRNKNREV
jgi:magnesium transporter